MQASKKWIIFIFLLISSINGFTQTPNTKYDKHLADSLGADEYGMKNYVLVILKTGSVKIEDQKISDSLFGGHMRNIKSLADQGKLVLAGPIHKNEKEYRGLFILNVKTIDEARDLLQTDPTIKAKLLDAELYNWYGAACLPMYLPYFEKVQQKSF